MLTVEITTFLMTLSPCSLLFISAWVFILLKQFTVDMVSRLTNEALCVSLFQNSQKKRGARPNNKPDKKLAAQVRTKHARTRLCFPPEGLTNQYETQCVAAWDTYSRRASGMRSYVCRFQGRRETFTELYHSLRTQSITPPKASARLWYNTAFFNS